MKQIRALLDQAHELAMVEVERLARQVITRNPSVTGFCMAMGSASFRLNSGEYVDGFYVERKYAAALFDFIGEYDNQLYLTGTPLKLDRVNGEIVKTHDW